jgi:flagellar L-ring protein precursor FlgH
MIMKSIFRWIAMLLGLGILAGCNSTPVRDPNYAPVRAQATPTPPRASGAIFHEGVGLLWFEDLRARRVGDILTVELTEKTDATKSAKSATKKSNTNSIANPTLLGMKPSKTLGNGQTATLEVQTESEHDFSGEGSASQNNALTGDVVVTVTEVLGNGNLIVRGEKRLAINQGNEYIKLSGTVRPYDIGPDNRVQSTKIADATIIYEGDGQVADGSVMGWLSKFFISAIMPF